MKVEFRDGIPSFLPETQEEEDQLFDWYKKCRNKTLSCCIEINYAKRNSEIELNEITVKDLGFELDKKFDHDQFSTSRYRKGELMVEFTYESNNLRTIDLIISDTSYAAISFKALSAIVKLYDK